MKDIPNTDSFSAILHYYGVGVKVYIKIGFVRSLTIEIMTCVNQIITYLFVEHTKSDKN